MAAPYNPPVKNQDFITGVMLESTVSPGLFKANPTLAAGDVTISKDFGAFANLATLPTVTPASGRLVKCEVSSTEMNCDVVSILFHDQTVPPEWADYGFSIPTTA